MTNLKFKTPVGPTIPAVEAPPVMDPLAEPLPIPVTATVALPAFEGMPKAFFVPSNWDLRSVGETIHGRNNITGHSYEGTMAGLNTMLAKVAS